MDKRLKRDAEHIITHGVDSEAMYKRVCNYLKELLHIRLETRPLSVEWVSVEDKKPDWIGYPPVICGFPGNRFEEGWTDAAVLSNGHRWVNIEGIEIYPTHWQPLPDEVK